MNHFSSSRVLAGAFVVVTLACAPAIQAQVTGLVAAYSFDEGTGTTTADRSGHGNTGTLVNGTAWYTAGKYGNAVRFDGQNDRIDIPDSSSLALTNAMTLEAWVRPTANSGYRTVVLKEVSGELSYSLYAADSDHGAHPSGWVRVAGASHEADGSSPLPLSVWSHIAATFDGANIRFYVNGALTRTVRQPGPIMTSNRPLRIGGNTIWGEYFAGQIDEVRIYSRVLSATEINTDMNTPITSSTGGGTTDTTLPMVSVNSPVTGSSLSGPVTLSASASDDVAVAGVQFRLNGANFGAEDTTPPYSVLWNTAGSPDGSYVITAVARDSSQNQTISMPVSVRVSNKAPPADTTPPTVSFTAPAVGARVSGTISVSANASDNVGVVGVQFKLDGVNLGAEDVSAPYTASWDTTRASNGTHTLSVVARDQAGSTATSMRNVTVANAVADTTPPTVSISSPARGATVSGTTTITATASDNVGVAGVQFKVDGVNLGNEDTAAPYSISWVTSSASNGTHTLSAVARDQAGLTATGTRTVTVSNSTGSGGGGSGIALTIDANVKYQTMDGFGVSANPASWDNGELQPALDMLVDQEGANLWRVVVEMADWEAQNDDSDPQHFNWTYYNTVFESPRFQEVWGTIAYLNQKGITSSLMIDVMGPSASWLGTTTLATSKEDEWVETIAALVYYARNVRNLQFGILAPNNEEDDSANEGIHMSASQYARVLGKLSTKLDGLGMSDLRLLGPDTGTIEVGVQQYIPQLMSSPALMAKMDHFALHNYSGSTGGADAAIKSSAYPTKNFWMTEVSDFTYVLSQIGQNASGIIVWDAYDSVYQHAILSGRGSAPGNDETPGYSALIAYNTSTHTYTPRTAFYQWGQLFRFIAPGSVRVSASSSSGRVAMYAFYHPVTGQVTIVGQSTDTVARTFTGTLRNVPVSVPALQFYVTDSTRKMARGTDVAVANGTFTFTAPPSSVFTLTYPGATAQ